ncbi:MAG: molybdopterin-dependent oxidoreductase [Alphaproteobacteria bacterium]|jgi:anaerobic selenocysteine-containing dehydrogenase|nr:molybdopterin-dependent oxidoreductase [Alphaproteobacteria bacterium]
MSETTFVKTTCPRDCYDSCGIRVELRDGEIARVLGDPEHPLSRGNLCAKCAIAYNGAWRDPELRLTQPMRRAGAKGGNDFEAVSWDAALADIARRLGEIAAGGGAHRILTAHYTGTCSVLAGDFPMRFFNRLGAREVEPDSICNLAGHIALDYQYGISVKGIDPETARDGACILVWGANPSAAGPHVHEHWLGERPGKLVVVDPVRTPTAEIADLYLQPFPGSDALLAFAIARVMQREGLIDEAFLAEHTIGWEALAETIESIDLDAAAQTTGVPLERIEAAARLYAAGPSILWLGQGLQRQATGGNVFRAVSMLPALTGNIGKPGSGLYYLNGKGATRNMDMSYVSAPHLRRDEVASLSHMDLAAALADPEQASALIVWNANPMASNPEQAALRRALGREDLFTVVIDLFQTDTADYADVVLPAAGFLEFDDLVGAYMHLTFGPQARAAAPLGEALPNQEIFRRLSEAMGFEEPELYEDDHSILDKLLGQTSLGLDFEALKAAGTVPVSAAPQVLFADLAFPTPSGRIELASTRAEADGHPLLPQPWADARPADGRFRLLSPASPWHMNSSYGNDANIQARAGPATVTLHPADAARLGLEAGARVWVKNDLAALEMVLAIADVVPPGVALSPKGRWPKHDPNGANVNALNPGDKADMGESTAVHAVEVEITSIM